MKEPIIIRTANVEARRLPTETDMKGGWIKRVIYPPEVTTKGIFFGVSEFNPGYSGHRWHTHTSDRGPGYEVDYPETFEEIYYLASGRGVVQWKDENGAVKEVKVGPGDAIFFPMGIAQHQLLNDGDEKISLIFCGTPTAKVTLK